MKKKISMILVIMFLFSSIAFASEKNYKAAILLETNTGRILYSYNKDEVLPQASITKLMTYYVFSDLISKNKVHPYDLITVDISNFDLPSDGSSVDLVNGQRVTIDELLSTLLIASANNSACQLQNIYKKYNGNIINEMNKKAKEIGMKNSKYINTTGLTEKEEDYREYNTTTVYDTALLSMRVIKEHPEVLHITSQRTYTFNNKVVENTNKLLFRSKYVDGLKTGHTSEAGYCLVATEDLSKTNGNGKPFRLLSIVFGCESEGSRVRESRNLLKYGENNFQNKILAEKSKVFTQNNEFYKLGVLGASVKDDVSMLSGKDENVEVSYKFNEKLTKSIKKGDNIGALTVKNKSTGEVKQYPLYANKDYKSVSFLKKLFIYIKNLFK